MPFQILSTRILEQGEKTATVELRIADDAEADKAVETLRIRTRVSLADSYLPALQVEAMQRAMTILADMQASVRRDWNHYKVHS